MAPNVSIAFSNEVLLKIFGMAPDEIPERNSRNQLAYANTEVDQFHVLFCSETPKVTFVPADVKTTRIHANCTYPHFVSPASVFKTTRGRERKVDDLVIDYNSSLYALGKSINVYLTLEYDKILKKFRISYPNNNNITINIKTSPSVANQLGFGSLDVIPYKMVPNVVSNDIDVRDLEKKARALVFDTGMVVVDLDQRTSMLNSYSGNTTMAMLEPTYDGIMRNPPHNELPRAHVTYFDPQLKFVLNRFGDDDQPHPLDWNIGAYVQGLVVGKV